MRLRRMLWIASLMGLVSCQPVRQVSLPLTGVTATPFQPVPATATAFHPLAASPTPVLPPAPDPLPSIEHWWQMDFSGAGQRIRLDIDPGGRAGLSLAFRTGWPCEYINHRACASVYLTHDVPVLLVTVHSGLGGEAEVLRDYLEGMGINRAALPLDQIQRNLSDLKDLPVGMEQGENDVTNLRVRAAVRIPPQLIEQYFSQPVPEALDLAASLDANFASALADPLLVIETCGWRHPDEPWQPGITDTSASIYLVAIGAD